MSNDFSAFDFYPNRFVPDLHVVRGVEIGRICDSRAAGAFVEKSARVADPPILPDHDCVYQGQFAALAWQSGQRICPLAGSGTWDQQCDQRAVDNYGLGCRHPPLFRAKALHSSRSTRRISGVRQVATEIDVNVDAVFIGVEFLAAFKISYKNRRFSGCYNFPSRSKLLVAAWAIVIHGNLDDHLSRAILSMQDSQDSIATIRQPFGIFVKISGILITRDFGRELAYCIG